MTPETHFAGLEPCDKAQSLRFSPLFAPFGRAGWRCVRVQEGKKAKQKTDLLDSNCDKLRACGIKRLISDTLRLTNLSRKRAKLRRNAFGLDDRILQAKTHSPRQPRFALQPAKREWRWAGAGGGANEKSTPISVLSVGSPCWTRTSDTLINSQVLYRLS